MDSRGHWAYHSVKQSIVFCILFSLISYSPRLLWQHSPGCLQITIYAAAPPMRTLNGAIVLMFISMHSFRRCFCCISFNWFSSTVWIKQGFEVFCADNRNRSSFCRCHQFRSIFLQTFWQFDLVNRYFVLHLYHFPGLQL